MGSSKQYQDAPPSLQSILNRKSAQVLNAHQGQLPPHRNSPIGNPAALQALIDRRSALHYRDSASHMQHPTLQAVLDHKSSQTLHPHRDSPTFLQRNPHRNSPINKSSALRDALNRKYGAALHRDTSRQLPISVRQSSPTLQDVLDRKSTLHPNRESPTLRQRPPRHNSSALQSVLD